MTADRAATFKASLGALNSQFAAWVGSQAGSAPHALWVEGARDYVKHAAGLVEEYKDVLGGAGGGEEEKRRDAPMRESACIFGRRGVSLSHTRSPFLPRRCVAC